MFPAISTAGFPTPGVAAPRQDRVHKHVKLLGIFWIILSAFHLFPGFWLLFFGRFALPYVPFHMRGLFLPLAAGMGLLLLAAAVLGIAAGWGLLTHQPWARILAIVLGIIALVRVPFGTALGIYTLWVLLPAGSDAEYRRMSRAA